MTIQEIALQLNRYDEDQSGEMPERYELYNGALSDIEAGELGDAKRKLRKALREKSDFDDGNLLLSLVLFAMGNRIDCMRQINEIADNAKHDKALDYVDALSSNGRKKAKAVENETAQERRKRKDEEAVSVRIFPEEQPEETADENTRLEEKAKPAAKPEEKRTDSDSSFEKLFKKAKKAQSEDIAKLENGGEDNASLASTRVSGAPLGSTVVAFSKSPDASDMSAGDAFGTEKTENSEENEYSYVIPESESQNNDIIKGEVGGTVTSEAAGNDPEPEIPEEPEEPEEPVTIVFDFEKMFDTGYSEGKELPAQETGAGEPDDKPVMTPPEEDKETPDDGKDAPADMPEEPEYIPEEPAGTTPDKNEADDDAEETYVTDETLSARSRRRAIISAGIGILLLALIAFAAYKLSL